MKVKVWKAQGGLIAAIILLIMCFAMTGLGIALIVLFSSYWYAFAIFTALWVAMIFGVFFDKDYLSRITLSGEEIEWTWFKKQVMTLKWEDVSDIRLKFQGRCAYDLVFIAEDNRKLRVALTFKLYSTIMVLCPYQSLKKLLENNIYLDSYRKLYKMKTERENEE